MSSSSTQGAAAQHQRRNERRHVAKQREENANGDRTGRGAWTSHGGTAFEDQGDEKKGEEESLPVNEDGSSDARNAGGESAGVGIGNQKKKQGQNVGGADDEEEFGAGTGRFPEDESRRAESTESHKDKEQSQGGAEESPEEGGQSAGYGMGGRRGRLPVGGEGHKESVAVSSR